MRTRHSLSLRFFFVAITLITLVTVILARVFYHDKTQQHLLEYGSDLLERMPVLVSSMVASGVQFEGDASPDELLEGYMGVWCNPQQQMVWQSAEAKQYQLDGLCRATAGQRAKSRIAKPVTLDNGQLFFVHTLPAKYLDQEGRYIALRDGSDFQQWQNDQIEQSLFIIAFVLLISILALFVVNQWAMRPLNMLESELKQVAKRNKTQLDQEYPVELQHLVGALNSLMAENETRTERYKNSLNDLAHSLKTRVAAMGVIAQEPDMPERNRAELLEQLSQMDTLVQYQLKRGLSGRQVLHSQATRLHLVITPLRDLLQKLHADHHIDLALRANANATTPMAHDDLMEVLGNLLENAFRFAISQIRVTQIDQPGGAVTLYIEDDGPGICSEQAQQVFQRGVRLDEKTAGQGIGLSVCADIVDSYHGSIRAERSELHGAKFVIDLPAAGSWWQVNPGK